MPNIYHFSEFTGELLSTGEADLDPVGKRPMVPSFSTLQAPPVAKAGKVACFVDGQWVLKPDQRGVVYWTTDGTQVTITEIGVTKPKDALDFQPRQFQLVAAMAQVDARHAGHLRTIAKGASQEEINTWTAKSLAARAIVAGTGAAYDEAFFTREAKEDGLTVPEVAQIVVAKADAYAPLIDEAKAIQKRAKKALEKAVAPDVPDADVAARIDAVLEQFKSDVAAAITLLNGGSK